MLRFYIFACFFFYYFVADSAAAGEPHVLVVMLHAYIIIRSYPKSIVKCAFFFRSLLAHSENIYISWIFFISSYKHTRYTNFKKY